MMEVERFYFRILDFEKTSNTCLVALSEEFWDESAQDRIEN